VGFVSFEESMKKLFESMDTSLVKERVFLDDAIGRVLAEDIVADHNSPAHPTSSMDGYAFKFDDQSMGRLKIQGELPAGSYKDEEVVGGMCIKTFTGSLICCGADTLVPIENVTVEGDDIIINEEVPFGFSVRPVGENYKEGEVLLSKGTKLDYAEIGVLASLNISQVSVSRKPNVSILSTGSEILDVGENQTNPSQIRSSNQFTLSALAKKTGAEVHRSPLEKDDKENIERVIKEALFHSDIVVTTGGVSVGDYDFVKDILAGLDAEYITQGVTLKPGQHIKIVKVGQKYIFALPGFPYSSTVTFILYVIPLIRYMLGLESQLPMKKAKLESAYKKKSRKTEVVVGNLGFYDNYYTINFKGKRAGSSAILTNMLGNTALIMIDKESADIEAGEWVEFIDMDAL
jgi:molybdopterin molybdotransferase